MPIPQALFDVIQDMQSFDGLLRSQENWEKIEKILLVERFQAQKGLEQRLYTELEQEIQRIPTQCLPEVGEDTVRKEEVLDAISRVLGV